MLDYVPDFRQTQEMSHSRLWRVIAYWLLLLLAGCADPPYTNIDNSDLRVLLAEGVPMYDIRRPEEWRRTGVVAGSRLLTFVDGRGRIQPDFMHRFEQGVAKEKPVILICQSGTRTDTLARHLVENLGYQAVYNVRRGIAGWLDAGLPAVPPQLDDPSPTGPPAR